MLDYISLRTLILGYPEKSIVNKTWHNDMETFYKLLYMDKPA